jgi:hypothetical protein
MTGFSGARWQGNVIVVTEIDRATSGILIELTSKADAKAKEAAQALASALRAEHLVVVGPQPIWPSLKIEGFGIADNNAGSQLTVGVNLPETATAKP